jgi:hypothetical protein
MLHSEARLAIRDKEEFSCGAFRGRWISDENQLPNGFRDFSISEEIINDLLFGYVYVVLSFNRPICFFSSKKKSFVLEKVVSEKSKKHFQICKNL